MIEDLKLKKTDLISPIAAQQSPLSDRQSPVCDLQSSKSDLQSTACDLQLAICGLQMSIAGLQSTIADGLMGLLKRFSLRQTMLSVLQRRFVFFPELFKVIWPGKDRRHGN
jgi:hypothetical protein